MQETQYKGLPVQRIFHGKTQKEIDALMNASLRPGEEVVRRIPLDESTIHAINRHERRKAQALARRERKYLP